MEQNNDDFIVIKRSWLISAVVGIIMFIAGGLVGAVLAIASYQTGVDRAVAAIEESLANQPSQPVVADQPQVEAPTPLPSRLDDVSVDDDPYLGPEDAPIVIVEFSDFR